MPSSGSPVNLLEQQQPDRKSRRDAKPPLLAVERCDLAVDKVPIDLAGELRQLVLEVDDLVKRSSRARNRSFEPIVLCFFGCIVPLRRR